MLIENYILDDPNMCELLVASSNTQQLVHFIIRSSMASMHSVQIQFRYTTTCVFYNQIEHGIDAFNTNSIHIHNNLCIL